MDALTFKGRIREMEKARKFIPLSLTELKELTDSQTQQLARLKRKFVQQSVVWMHEVRSSLGKRSLVSDKIRERLSIGRAMSLAKEVQHPAPYVARPNAALKAVAARGQRLFANHSDFGLHKSEMSLLHRWQEVLDALSLWDTHKIKKYTLQDRIFETHRTLRKDEINQAKKDAQSRAHPRRHGHRFGFHIPSPMMLLLRPVSWAVRGVGRMLPRLFRPLLGRGAVAAEREVAGTGLTAATERMGLRAILTRLAPGFMAREAVAAAAGPETLGVGTVVITILNVLATIGMILWAFATPKLKKKITTAIEYFFKDLWFGTLMIGKQILNATMQLNAWMFKALPKWITNLVPESQRKVIENPPQLDTTTQSLPTPSNPKGLPKPLDEPAEPSMIRYPEADRWGTYGGKKYRTNQVEFQNAVKWGAMRLGVPEIDLATVIAYETAGTLSPDVWGGVGGKYLGLIQFSPDSQSKYGVRPGMTYLEQMKAVVRYLKDRGVKPGMTGIYIYSAINAGRAESKYWGRSDAGAGGRPGSVQWKYEQDMTKQRANMQALMSRDLTPPPGQLAVLAMPAPKVAMKTDQASVSPLPVEPPRVVKPKGSAPVAATQTNPPTKTGSYTGPTINDGGVQVDDEDATMAQAYGAI